MTLKLLDKKFPNINEIWSTGSNSLVVTTKGEKGRRIKITAMQKIRSMSSEKYEAEYEEEIVLNKKNKKRIWVSVEFPRAYGNSITVCLKSALKWVNEQR